MGFPSRKSRRPNADQLREAGLDPGEMLTGEKRSEPETESRGGQSMGIRLSSEVPQTQQQLAIDKAFAERDQREKEREAEMLADARRRLKPAVEIAKKYIDTAAPHVVAWQKKAVEAEQRLVRLPYSIKTTLAGSQHVKDADRCIKIIQALCNTYHQLQTVLREVDDLSVRTFQGRLKKQVDLNLDISGLQYRLMRGAFDPVKAYADVEGIDRVFERLAGVIAEEAERRLRDGGTL